MNINLVKLIKNNMLIKVNTNQWINTAKIKKVEVYDKDVYITMDNDNINDNNVIRVTMKSKEEMNKYIEKLSSAFENNMDIMNKLMEEILEMKGRINDMENAFKYMAGGEEYKKAFREYHEIKSGMLLSDKEDSTENEMD